MYPHLTKSCDKLSLICSINNTSQQVITTQCYNLTFSGSQSGCLSFKIFCFADLMAQYHSINSYNNKYISPVYIIKMLTDPESAYTNKFLVLPSILAIICMEFGFSVSTSNVTLIRSTGKLCLGVDSYEDITLYQLYMQIVYCRYLGLVEHSKWFSI